MSFRGVSETSTKDFKKCVSREEYMDNVNREEYLDNVNREEYLDNVNRGEYLDNVNREEYLDNVNIGCLCVEEGGADDTDDAAGEDLVTMAHRN
ncbi:hypothetical protein BgiMline_022135 [Biomphalaria glabrata]